MKFLVLVIVLAVIAVLTGGYWWRHRWRVCPARLSWVLENPYFKAVAGPEKIFQRIRLREGMKLLDVGCGAGRLAVPAAMWVGKAGEVTALDIQSRMLEKVHARVTEMAIDNVRIINAAAGSGRLERDYYDRALLVTVLGELPNKHEALLEIYDALKAGGILSVTELMPDPHYMGRDSVRTLCHGVGFKESESFGKWFAFTVNFVKPSGS
jgi:ubiquinone/menaquinone biosynthesis C-methylase UbiE